MDTLIELLANIGLGFLFLVLVGLVVALVLAVKAALKDIDDAKG